MQTLYLYQGSRSEATRNMKGRLWERIRKTRVNKNLVSGKPEVSSVYDDYSITELPLSHFLIVLRFYETERAKYPKIPAYDFVGRHWGGGTVELLQDYVASSLRAIEK